MTADLGTLLRVLNNNAVMVDTGGGRLILLGRGIGFGRQLGDRIELGVAHEIFSPSGPADLRQLTDFVTEIPIESFEVARLAVDLATSTAGIHLSQALLLAIADHLHFAVLRAQQGVTIDFPLKWEISQIYPRELSLGREVIDLTRQKLGVTIAEDEAVAFAMHFVNAQFARADVSETVAMTESLSQIVSEISTSLGPEISLDSMSVARFVTHLRYLYARIASESQFANDPPLLLSAMHDAYPEVAGLAQRVRFLIESQRGKHTRLSSRTAPRARLPGLALGQGPRSGSQRSTCSASSFERVWFSPSVFPRIHQGRTIRRPTRPAGPLR